MAQSPSGDDPTSGVPYIDSEGDQHFNGTSIWYENSWIRRGTPAICTIASGVLTATQSFIAAAAESGTADQVDSIALSGITAVAGDELIIVPDAGDTITFDDANIDLGAATRACAPGGSITLRYDGTSWYEVTFLAAADNA